MSSAQNIVCLLLAWLLKSHCKELNEMRSGFPAVRPLDGKRSSFIVVAEEVVSLAYAPGHCVM